MCKALEISRSGYYAWRKRGSSHRDIENEMLLKAIIQSHEQSRKLYGSPRITAELLSKNIKCSRNRIAKLMKTNNIRSKIKRKHRVTTTNSKHRFPVSPNRLMRQFSADRPNQVWLSDITYLKVGKQWLYLVAIMDLYSRQIISWELSSDLSATFLLKALKRAVAERRPERGLIFHSDRGVQYAGLQVRLFLQEHGILQSMSRKGDCYDNAVMESFFKTFKSEFFTLEKFDSEYDVRWKTFDYIDIFYNHKRLHSSLQYMSPVNFEIQFNKRAFPSVHLFG